MTATTEFLSTCTKAFAEPDASNIIDVIHPITNRGAYSNETLEQVRIRYPLAEIIDIQAHCEAKAKRQDSPIIWDEVTERKYWEMLEVLPPAVMHSGAFMVGEPCDHHATTGAPRFSCYYYTKDASDKTTYYGASRPMTVKEFNAKFRPAR